MFESNLYEKLNHPRSRQLSPQLFAQDHGHPCTLLSWRQTHLGLYLLFLIQFPCHLYRCALLQDLQSQFLNQVLPQADLILLGLRTVLYQY